MHSLLKPGGELFLLFLQTNPMYYIMREFRKYPKFKEYATKIPNVSALYFVVM